MSDTGGGRTCSAQEVFQRYLIPRGRRGVVGVLDGGLSGLVGWPVWEVLWMDFFFLGQRERRQAAWLASTPRAGWATGESNCFSCPVSTPAGEYIVADRQAGRRGRTVVGSNGGETPFLSY